MTAGNAAVPVGSSLVLLTLAAGQFLMTLDSSVMNVSIATVAQDVGTTVSGIQTAITLYTLVMASLMITGGKIGAKLGYRRAFMIGCVIYGAGSLTTAVAPNLTILLIGWSLLEGVGAALILPAIVALVAVNFTVEGRPRAFGIVAASGAIAVAAGPLIGGFMTTYLSWRLVFVGEVAGVIAILAFARRLSDPVPQKSAPLDWVGAVLTAAGLGVAVFGVLRSSEWGWVRPNSESSNILGLSPTIWLILTGLLILWLFLQWELRLERENRVPLVQTSLFQNRQMTGGLLMFFFQFLIQAGVFFVIPLFLTIILGISALETGIRLLPLSVTLLIAALGIPKFLPDTSPRLVVRAGLLCLLAGTVLLLALIDIDANAGIVSVPLLLIGAGIGALASQLGNITVSAVPDEQSAEVGGLQNTATNLGASLGTALAGSVLIAILSATLLTGLEADPAIPGDFAARAKVELAGGVPFLSDEEVETALIERGLAAGVVEAAVEANREARIAGLDGALALLAIVAVVALFAAQRVPDRQPAATTTTLNPG